MAEEQKWQETNNHILCANNCGFFGSPTTLNLCSKCYKDRCLKQQQISKANSLTPPQTSSSSSSSAVAVESIVSQVAEKPQKRNRCGTCRQRVGLTGFTCRCGATFCGTHRYPEQHGCSFDFKAVGKEAIAKANPVVKAAKLDKI